MVNTKNNLNYLKHTYEHLNIQKFANTICTSYAFQKDFCLAVALKYN